MIKNKIFRHRKLFLTFFLLLIFFVFSYFYLIQPALSLYAQSKRIPLKLRPLLAAFYRQDYMTLEFELKYFRQELVEINKNASKIALISPLPIIGSYAGDLKRISAIILEAYDATIDFTHFIIPLLPTINFSGWVPGPDALANANPNLDEITRLLPLLGEELPKYKERIKSINNLLSEIDERRYPEQFRGLTVREKIKQMKETTDFVSSSFDDIIKILPLVPEAIGVKEPKNYLVLIQNEKELRPSGGLLSGYAFFAAAKGRFGLIKSGDTFFLDETVVGGKYPTAPSFVASAIGNSELRLRDANYSPDFSVSSKSINDIWMKTPKPFGLEGIIAIDNHLLKSLVKIFGDIKINDSEVVNEANIDQLLQNFYKYAGDRTEASRPYKGVVSILLNEILKKTFALAAHSYNTPLRVLVKEGAGKHLLLNFYSPKLQNLAENRGLSGAIKNYNGDYLHISNAIYSAKRNGWDINQTVVKDTKKESGKIITILKIETEGKPLGKDYDLSNKFNIRVYVPKGSKLLEAKGIKASEEEDLGKTVFSTLVTLEPSKKMDLELTYETPVELDKEYKILIQKQPGTEDYKYKISFNDKSTQFNLNEDKEINIKL